MRSSNNKGFVLLAVISLIALIPTAILLMSRNTTMLVNNNRTTQLTAQCHNLLMSGFAWTEKNSTALADKEVGWQVNLDVTGMDIEGGRCSLTVKKIELNSIEIELAAECSRGQRQLKRTETCTINR